MSPRSARALLCGLFGALVLLGCSGDERDSDAAATSETAAEEAKRWTVWSEAEEQWRVMERVEDLIIILTPEMSRLGQSVANLQFPALAERDIFAPEVEVVDIGPAEPVGSDENGLAIGHSVHHPLGEETTRPIAELDLWRPFLDSVLYFDAAKFKIKTGEMPEVGSDTVTSGVAFSAKAHLTNGEVVGVDAKSEVTWRNFGAPDGEEDWRIDGWRTLHFDVQGRKDPLFEEVLAQSMPDLETLQRARHSQHERYVIDFILHPDTFEPPSRYFTVPSEDFHPGIAVVDLDQDGHDDFYVMVRWGPNMFFRNRGDGSFEEIAASLGLDVVDHSGAAIFADFDNDGDADLMLGRSLARSQLMMNEDGRFVDRSEELVSEPLPYFTSSVSAVDYDGDGLLDIYLSTYMKILMIREFFSRRGQVEDGMLKDFLPLNDARRLAELRLAPDFQQYLNHPGPPNMLLHNTGNGHFKVVYDVPALRVFRNTFQSTWGDYDRDGDPDVYIANDFGPNNLVRNDGGGRFTDVTGETGTADIGFGMGASWGDYDNDGRSDLYVSNMYSTAGNRILKKLDHVDDTFLGAARGNTLFRNASESFEKVSGVEAPALTVEKAGWSWAGQFTDLDNDGFEDIYALSGFYTAAKEVAIDRDT